MRLAAQLSPMKTDADSERLEQQPNMGRHRMPFSEFQSAKRSEASGANRAIVRPSDQT